MLLSYLWLSRPFFFLPLSSVNSWPKHDLGFTLKSIGIYNFLKANIVYKTSEILASMINCRMRITTS